MPSISQAQQKFLGMDYARAKAGEPTRTKMSIGQLKDFASTPRKGLPRHVRGGSRR